MLFPDVVLPLPSLSPSASAVPVVAVTDEGDAPVAG